MVTQGRRLHVVETKPPSSQPARSAPELLLRGRLPPLLGAAAAAGAALGTSPLPLPPPPRGSRRVPYTSPVVEPYIRSVL
ncbi:E3 ubiquitin-protein ligase RNF182 isoform X3 [Elephas maximus indicus]|uniref:E3 ubiquitin-protein ligase RNF182 isoform X3 n=1 Tax=Elephas maximus indicus TaxID=99487 RepID=UPI002116E720|nr:E3 ubiquitin-protein ligase RNF182 isoform X3 [Elephas maximus indicus]